MAYTFATLPYDFKISTMQILGNEETGVTVIYEGVPEWSDELMAFTLPLTPTDLGPYINKDITLTINNINITLYWVAQNDAWISGPEIPGEVGLVYDTGFIIYFVNGDDYGQDLAGQTFKLSYIEQDTPEVETVSLIDESGVIFSTYSHGEYSRYIFSDVSAATSYQGEELAVVIDDVTRNDTNVDVSGTTVTLVVDDNGTLGMDGLEHTVLITYVSSGGGGGIVPEGSYYIDQNGTYDITEYAEVEVEVPLPSGTISITTNGTVDVSWAETADVNVPTGTTPTGNININADGVYDVASYAQATVSTTPTYPTATLTVNNTTTNEYVFYVGISGKNIYPTEITATGGTYTIPCRSAFGGGSTWGMLLFQGARNYQVSGAITNGTIACAGPIDLAVSNGTGTGWNTSCFFFNSADANPAITITYSDPAPIVI